MFTRTRLSRLALEALTEAIDVVGHLRVDALLVVHRLEHQGDVIVLLHLREAAEEEQDAAPAAHVLARHVVRPGSRVDLRTCRKDGVDGRRKAGKEKGESRAEKPQLLPRQGPARHDDDRHHEPVDGDHDVGLVVRELGELELGFVAVTEKGLGSSRTFGLALVFLLFFLVRGKLQGQRDRPAVLEEAPAPLKAKVERLVDPEGRPRIARRRDNSWYPHHDPHMVAAGARDFSSLRQLASRISAVAKKA
jgi:hypothetical protein